MAGLAARAGRGERAAMAEFKRNHVHAALQHVAEEIAGTPGEGKARSRAAAARRAPGVIVDPWGQGSS